MNQLLILTSYTKFELNSLINNRITIKLRLEAFLAVSIQRKSEMTLYLNNGCDAMNFLPNLKKFLPHSIIMPSFVSVGG